MHSPTRMCSLLLLHRTQNVVQPCSHSLKSKKSNSESTERKFFSLWECALKSIFFLRVCTLQSLLIELPFRKKNCFLWECALQSMFVFRVRTLQSMLPELSFSWHKKWNKTKHIFFFVSVYLAVHAPRAAFQWASTSWQPYPPALPRCSAVSPVSACA